MSQLFLMTTISDRRLLPRFVTLYQNNRVDTSFIVLGHGTVSGTAAALFLDSAEKAVSFSVVTKNTWKTVQKKLRSELQIDVPGVGVAFIVPLSAIGGRRELSFLTDGQDFVREEESIMQGTDRELLVVISEPGYNETVMDAAREAGAYGGTVIHARGTGMQKAEKFLGISLASEKDMTMIVVRTSQRDRIMMSVMRKAGLATPAKSIVFSLPVTDTAGLRLSDAEEDAEAASPAGTSSAAAGGSQKAGSGDL